MASHHLLTRSEPDRMKPLPLKSSLRGRSPNSSEQFLGAFSAAVSRATVLSKTLNETEAHSAHAVRFPFQVTSPILSLSLSFFTRKVRRGRARAQPMLGGGSQRGLLRPLLPATTPVGQLRALSRPGLSLRTRLHTRSPGRGPPPRTEAHSA